MNLFAKITLLTISLAFAVIIPFYYETILTGIVQSGIMGWVFTSILIRLVVMVLFILALKATFLLFKRTQRLKNWIVILIGAVPGFFLSFAIAPIYALDYGMFDDGMKIEAFDHLESASEYSYERTDNYELLAFFEVGCYFCQLACQKLAINHDHGQTVPVHVFFAEENEHIDPFIEANNGQALNVHTLDHDSTFVKHAGFQFPSIYLIDPEGKTEYHWIGDQMNYSALDYLLGLEQ